MTKQKNKDILFSDIRNRTFFTGTKKKDTDNLTVLRQMDSESVDLIYLDPPFNSKRDYAAPIDSAAADVGASNGESSLARHEIVGGEARANQRATAGKEARAIQRASPRKLAGDVGGKKSGAAGSRLK